MALCACQHSSCSQQTTAWRATAGPPLHHLRRSHRRSRRLTPLLPCSGEGVSSWLGSLTTRPLCAPSSATRVEFLVKSSPTPFFHLPLTPFQHSSHSTRSKSRRMLTPAGEMSWQRLQGGFPHLQGKHTWINACATNILGQVCQLGISVPHNYHSCNTIFSQPRCPTNAHIYLLSIKHAFRNIQIQKKRQYA